MLTEIVRQTVLQPARVIGVNGSRLLVELSERSVWAVVAFVGAYRPVVDDVVLVIGQEDAWYAIGVIHGTGPVRIVAPGDISLQAPNGCVELSGREVRLRGTDVSVTAVGRLELVARTVSERFEAASRWVRQAFQLRAGRYRAQVEADYRLTADRIVERAKRDVSIDGSKINLG